MNRSISWWLGMLMFMSTLFGVAGGGVMGGIAGYYVANSQKPAVSLVSVSHSAALLLTQQNGTGNASVKQETAVTSVVKRSEPAVITVLNTMQVSSKACHEL